MKNKNKKYLFFVQGEGRGHMTQAIALYDILVKNGDEVCAVIVGKNKRRELPSYFLDNIRSNIFHIESPNFVLDKYHKSVNINETIIHNIKKIR